MMVEAMPARKTPISSHRSSSSSSINNSINIFAPSRGARWKIRPLLRTATHTRGPPSSAGFWSTIQVPSPARSSRQRWSSRIGHSFPHRHRHPLPFLPSLGHEGGRRGRERERERGKCYIFRRAIRSYPLLFSSFIPVDDGEIDLLFEPAPRLAKKQGCAQKRLYDRYM
ncbi:unnamed protein product [Ectocarpus fasciculatus]